MSVIATELVKVLRSTYSIHCKISMQLSSPIDHCIGFDDHRSIKKDSISSTITYGHCYLVRVLKMNTVCRTTDLYMLSCGVGMPSFATTAPSNLLGHVERFSPLR